MKYLSTMHNRVLELSRPARGAWVEIAPRAKAATCWGVAPRKGRVG